MINTWYKRFKTKLDDSTFPGQLSIHQQQQHMDFTLYISYVILWFALNRVIYLTEFSRWHKKNHRYKCYKVVITNGMIATKYTFLYDNRHFSFYVDLLSFPYHRLDFYRTWQYEKYSGCLIRNRKCLSFASTWVQNSHQTELFRDEKHLYRGTWK